MSHDLQFNVQNGDGSFTPAPPPLPSGAMSHLPSTAMPPQQQPTEPKMGTVEFISNKLSQSSHPTVIVFHILFKLLALLLYLFGGWFLGGAPHTGSRFIFVMVAAILLLAADFWVVKNITGRLLVGLRWWNKVENETTTWIFESAEQQAVNAFDRTVFWTVLYATPVVWGILFVMGLMRLKFQWLLIVCMALALSSANVYGYYKCSTDQKARFQQMMQQGAQQGAMAMMRSNMMSVLTGQTANNNNNTYV